MRLRKNKIRLLLLFISVLIFSQTTYSQTATKKENIMAAYIYNFIKFFEWPDSNKGNDLIISVIGKSDIAESLSSLAEKTTLPGRNIIVKEISNMAQLGKTSVLFIATKSEKTLREIKYNLPMNGLLTLSYAKGFAEKGVGINFIDMGDKIKFEINRKVLETNGIATGSRILALAAKIYDSY